MTTQKKKDLRDQYQVADLREYDVMRTCTTAYPMRRAVTGKQWSEKLVSKRMSKSTPPSLVEKISTSEIVDTEEEIQFKRPVKRTLKEKLQAKDDSRRYSTSDIQLISCLLDVPDVVSIQYQEGDKPDVGAQNVSLQVSLPAYQNMDIVLSEDNEPVQKPAHRVPVAMKEKFRKELQSMAKAGIISKLDRSTPTPWLNSYVIVKKPNGSLRVCLDPTDLSKYIVQPVCNSRTLDDVSHQLKDAKYFSVFDATKGFFHLPLSAKSRLLTAMLMPEGIYVFNALAMQLCNAGNLFESALRDLLSGLLGVMI